ncbi:MAG: protease modulator HflC [Rhodospirillaceae bacterium]|nr:protease modulator HflC [Rhodospirillaceae bacterium]
MARGLVIAGVGVVVLGVVGLSSVFVVHQREQAIVLELGRFVRVENTPGLHFKTPFIQDVRYFDKRVLDFEADLGEINTSDQKQTQVDTYARYRIIDPLKFMLTARSLERFESRREDAILNTIIKSNVREVFAKVELSTLLTAKRADVMADITKRVRREVESFGVEIIDVRIKRIDLPQANSEAVLRRMEAQRRQEATRIRAEGDKEYQRITAETDKQVRVIKAEAEQKANVLRGQGEGEAQAIYNRAFGQDKDFFEFWQCMRTVREGLGSGTRLVGVPSADLLLQLCRTPKPATTGERPANKADKG